MDPLTTYGWLERSRARVFDGVRSLDEASWTREFEIGPGSLGQTFKHMLIAEWYYIERLLGRSVPPHATWDLRDDTPLLCAELEARWTTQAEETRAAIASERDWDRSIEYQVTDDEGREMIITCTPAGLFTQLVTHEVHHRSQAINMLRRMGVSLGEIDFNSMEFPRREA